MFNLTPRIVGWPTGDDSGQALAEYALLLALIAIAAIGSLTTLSGEITAIFNAVANELANAI